MARLLVLFSILVYGSSAKNSKRILLTDPDFADNQQLHKDVQNLKALVQQMQGTIQNQARMIEKFAVTGTVNLLNLVLHNANNLCVTFLSIYRNLLQS